jgi:hypothetical protein
MEQNSDQNQRLEKDCVNMFCPVHNNQFFITSEPPGESGQVRLRGLGCGCVADAWLFDLLGSEALHEFVESEFSNWFEKSFFIGCDLQSVVVTNVLEERAKLLKAWSTAFALGWVKSGWYYRARSIGMAVEANEKVGGRPDCPAGDYCPMDFSTDEPAGTQPSLYNPRPKK